MAVLKKGAKGGGVKELQTLLNKNGAKPALKVDGDFGPLTEAAVKAWQKQAKLKTDGQAGDETMASLKFGGPLPEMTVRDYAKRRDELHKAFDYNQENMLSFGKIETAAEALVAIGSRHAPKIRELFDSNYDDHAEVAKLVGKLVELQAGFAKLVTKDPAKAAALVKECEALDKKVDAIGKGKISPNLKKANSLSTELKKVLDDSYRVIAKELAAIDKRQAEY